MTSKPSAGAAAVMAAAARAVAAVAISGRSAEEALLESAQAAERSAIRAVTLGALRWWLRFEPAVLPLLQRPGGDTPPLLRALLVVAVHQLEMSRNPRESTVSAAVDAARLLRQPRAAGAVNAVLRRFLREREAVLASVDELLPQRTAHPGWLVDSLLRQWPERTAAILAGNNAHPPMTLRVARSRISIADYLQMLQEAGIEASAAWSTTAVTLARALPVKELPGFAAGLVSVQDAGAQFAAQLLEVQPGERVLDACAAPGGKTGALLELVESLEVTAIDNDAQRLRRVRENLERLGREAQLLCADLAHEPDWWDGRSFDRILLDVPCSATGVIRRHPDIKLLRRATDIAPLTLRQLTLLKRCWPMLKPGGQLLYVTCSVLSEENASVVGRFLAEEPSARLHTPPASAHPALLPCLPGWQLLPGGEAGSDGFYYASLTRI